MKKADCTHKRKMFPRMLVTVCFFLCLSAGCGLDTNYYLDEPSSDGHTVDYTTADPTQQYFSFRTTEAGNNGGFGGSTFTFKGTEIYYKIYSDASTMVSNERSIDGQSAVNAANAIINTYTYKTLKFSSGSTPDPLIPATGSNRYVYIRLHDYNTNYNSDYRNAVQVGSSAMMKFDASRAVGYPRRYKGNGYGFDFGKNTDSNEYCNSPVPASGDDDFYGTQTNDGPWYVDMYAVSVGHDSTNNSYSYSSVIRLGSLTINKYN